MSPLATDLRRLLERKIIEARDVAEAGAKAALDRLALTEEKPYSHLTADERELRKRLRAKARQLGDELESRRQEISRLVHEVAYEHWHRMLFARFLAENGLLIHPDLNVAVTLKECQEFARDEGGRADAWTVAGRFAARMLPQVFRPDDPVLQLPMAPEDQLKLEKILEDLPAPIFLADDALGWVYQFWQSKRKDEVNAAGDKITSETLPAVTQLFTEHYMVLFLLHNTIGAWWAGKQGIVQGSEAELRGRVALPGYEFEYLRFLPDGAPAAGTFQGWPKRAADLRVLDPCCGSGHFLVTAFDLLVRLRMKEEDLPAERACEAVLRDNLFGLELDARCTQIAAFALGFAAWKFLGRIIPLPPLKIACSGLSVGVEKEEWVRLAGKDVRLRAGMDRLYELFEQGPTLGSLINPRALGGDLLEAGFRDLQPLLARALASEASDATAHELAITAQGLAQAAEILAGQFTLVATNVPYLGRGKQDDVLKEYCEHRHPEAKTDLATSFVERCLDFCADGGSYALVTPQNWLFLGTYKNLRKRLLEECQWNTVARLGPRAFETISGEVVSVALIVCSRIPPSAVNGFLGSNVSEGKTPSDKARALITQPCVSVSQAGQLANPDSAVLLETIDSERLLGRYAECFQGLSSTDAERFVLCFWEFPGIPRRWRTFQGPPNSTVEFAGREYVLDWETLSRGVEGAALRGQHAWGKRGVAIGQVSCLPATLYSGDLFADSAPVIVPRSIAHEAAIWAFVSALEFHEQMRRVNSKLSVNNGYVAKVPFDLTHWQQIVAEKYRSGLPKPYSNDPTQWLFSGYPQGSQQPLQVAVARLLGYRWPRQTGSSFPDCPAIGSDGLEEYADDDGVVCLPVVGTERPAAERLRDLLAAAYGKEWTVGRLDQMLAEVDFSGKTLDDWLRDGFFEQHCQIFHQRPFIWHIWDGRRRDGFHALVNCHRLDRELLEKLAYTYLRDWMRVQETDAKRGVAGADARLAAARALQEKLKLIIEGEDRYDVFVRWKPIELQPIGWDPDLNDGVRMNIRPFVTAQVLRKDPKINWNADRGKDPATAPWYKLFKGERRNDHHLTLQEKRDARAPVKQGAKR